jgi:ubiquinone/menaquinone biosynthesis C-methylase UbiE
MTLFNSIGKMYGNTRQADERIVVQLVRHLDLKRGSTIADIGAGTGNYSVALADAGFKIKAIEPSHVMISHARQHASVEWLAGCAEDIPLKNESGGGVISVLALCHFSDAERAFREMARVLKHGPIVIFTFDPKSGRKTWLYDYFPYFWDAFEFLLPIEDMAKKMRANTGLSTQIIPFRLPPDLRDNFAAAGWRKPYLYLADEYRSNISSFHLTESTKVNQSVERLAADLTSGRWDELYGEVLHLEEIDAGYRFLCAR